MKTVNPTDCVFSKALLLLYNNQWIVYFTALPLLLKVIFKLLSHDSDW